MTSRERRGDTKPAAARESATAAGLVGLLGLGENDLLIRFGSRDGADEDFLAVLTGESAACAIDARGLDLLVLGHLEFSQLLSVFDPRVTEPVLTGELIFGNRGVLDSTRARLRSAGVDDATIEQIWWQGSELLRNAIPTLRAAGIEHETALLRRSLTDLGFGVALVALARRYVSQPAVATLIDLLPTVPILADIRAMQHAQKRGVKIQREQINDVCKQARSFWLSVQELSRQLNKGLRLRPVDGTPAGS